MKKLPAHCLPLEKITLSAISPEEEDRQSPKSILDENGWTIGRVQPVREATRLMTEKPALMQGLLGGPPPVAAASRTV